MKLSEKILPLIVEIAATQEHLWDLERGLEYAIGNDQNPAKLDDLDGCSQDWAVMGAENVGLTQAVEFLQLYDILDRDVPDPPKPMPSPDWFIPPGRE